MAQWPEHYHNLTDEKIGPQMAQSIFGGEGYLMKCILPQAALVIWLDTLSILGHIIEALQHGHHH